MVEGRGQQKMAAQSRGEVGEMENRWGDGEGEGVRTG